MEKDQDINDKSPVPENTSSENSASTNKVDETIIPLAPVSENIELEATDTPPLHPKNMEIHHQGHVHEQKKWKEYLFQFLMLFLAVFCGFLAEYQLEHKIEKDREKQYMEGMLEDLVSDTAMLASTIQFAIRISNGLDSLQNNFFDTDNAVANTQMIYRQNTTYLRLIVPGFSDQTAIQLRIREPCD